MPADATIIVPALAFGFKLFAQATPVPAIDPGLGSLIGNLGVVVVLAWFLYYTTTKSQPDMLKQFAAENEKSRAEREAERISDEKESNAWRGAKEREMNELRSMLIQSLQDSALTRQDMRIAVHDVKDTAQTAVNQAAVAAKAATGSGTRLGET